MLQLHRLEGPRAVYENGAIGFPREMLSLLDLVPGGPDKVWVGVHGEPASALVVVRDADVANWVRAGYAAAQALRPIGD